MFAGVKAVASQHRRSAIWFANPLLYALGQSKLVFHDVAAPVQPVAMTATARYLLTMGQDSSLTATRGYDHTTGLGTPNGARLLVAETLPWRHAHHRTWRSFR